MAPSRRGVQLTFLSGGRRRAEISAREDFSDLEDVRLLDSYEDEEVTAVEREEEGKGMRRIQVRISGMTCSACTSAVESAIGGVPGVLQVTVSMLQNKARVLYDLDLVKDEDIKIAIEDAGFEAEVLLDSNIAQSRSQKTLTGQFRIGGMTCAACVNSVEGILRNIPGIKRAVVALATSSGEVEYDPSIIGKEEIVNAVEDAGFEAAFLQSSEQDKFCFGVDGLYCETDVHLLQGILRNSKGVKQFEISNNMSEMEVIFDPEAIGLRSIVDAIENESGGELKATVRNPYSRAASNDAKEISKMFRLFVSSFILSVPIFVIRAICSHIPFLNSFLLMHCGPFVINMIC